MSPKTLLGFCMLVMFLGEGCSVNKIQAPYDSFVCFDSSFNQCLARAQSGELESYLASLKNHNSSLASLTDLNSSDPLVSDPDKDKTVPTRDLLNYPKYSCNFGSIPYQSTLQRNQEASVVFVSPVLLSQIGDQMIRLNRLRTGCARLVQTYNYELDVLALQDELSIAEQGTGEYSTQIEAANNVKQGWLGAILADAEADKYHVAHGSSANEALGQARRHAIEYGRQLRDRFKDQTTSIDYRDRFTDANLAIELQERELGRSLFVQDRSAVAHPRGWERGRDYNSGSWVKQGTIVFSVWQWPRWAE